MARTQRRGAGKRQRRISVRAVRRSAPDMTKLSRALVLEALQQAAAEAAAARHATDSAQSSAAEDTGNA